MRWALALAKSLACPALNWLLFCRSDARNWFSWLVSWRLLSPSCCLSCANARSRLLLSLALKRLVCWSRPACVWASFCCSPASVVRRCRSLLAFRPCSFEVMFRFWSATSAPVWALVVSRPCSRTRLASSMFPDASSARTRLSFACSPSCPAALAPCRLFDALADEAASALLASARFRWFSRPAKFCWRPTSVVMPCRARSASTPCCWASVWDVAFPRVLAKPEPVRFPEPSFAAAIACRRCCSKRGWYWARNLSMNPPVARSDTDCCPSVRPRTFWAETLPPPFRRVACACPFTPC